MRSPQRGQAGTSRSIPRFTSIEQFIVGREEIAALTKTGVIVHFSIGRIRTVRPRCPKRLAM